MTTQLTTAPTPPAMTSDNIKRIQQVFPAEMLALRQWVSYSANWSVKLGKFGKIPINPNNGSNAKTNDPKTWGTFDVAAKRALNLKLAGVGFVFSANDPYVGIDLDKCINGDGEIETWASDIISELNSYTELSPSGTGYHIIGRGKLPPQGRRKDRIEMYESGRFFTVTGSVQGSGTLRDFQVELAAFHARIFKRNNAKRTEPKQDFNDLVCPALSDAEVIDIASRDPERGTKFTTLWRGAWHDLEFPSQSEADQALCNHLAWWTDYNADRLDGLFRQSGLFRPEKWDKPHYSDGRTYGLGTIEKAIAGHSPGDGYDPKSKKKDRLPKRKSASSLPSIVVNRQLNEIITDTWELVHQVNRQGHNPLIFLRQGQLVRIREDVTPDAIEIMTKDSITTYLFNHADWLVTREGATRPAKPPKEIIASLISDPDNKLPRLELFETVPFFSKNGELIQNEGYHQDLRIWLKLSADLNGINIPTHPSSEDIAKSVSLFLDDLLVDFPFVSQADRANALAAFLLTFVRQMVDGPTPLHLIDAPTPGSGKGLLANLISIVATGDRLVIQTLPYNEDELRKRVSSELIKGRPIIAFDNVDTRRRLDSGTLAAALTANIWSDRMLGLNKDITVRNRSMWVLTGNNLQTSGEIADRVVWIRIDPKMERPRERGGFKHEWLEEWTSKNRLELVEAALTMVSAWVQAGQPYSGRKIGSFENWTRVIGGVLQFCGIEGFLQNREKFYEHADEENETWHAFVKSWWTAFATTPVTVKALFGLCEENDLLLSVRGDKSDRSQQTRLGKALTAARDRMFADLRINTTWTRNSAGNPVPGYQLVKIESNDQELPSEDSDSEDKWQDSEAPF